MLETRPAAASSMHPRECIEDDARDHDHKIRAIKPEKLRPRILWPPVLAHLFYEAAAEQRLINAMHHVSGHRKPKREKQRHVDMEVSLNRNLLFDFTKGPILRAFAPHLYRVQGLL